MLAILKFFFIYNLGFRLPDRQAAVCPTWRCSVWCGGEWRLSTAAGCMHKWWTGGGIQRIIEWFWVVWEEPCVSECGQDQGDWSPDGDWLQEEEDGHTAPENPAPSRWWRTTSPWVYILTANWTGRPTPTLYTRRGWADSAFSESWDPSWCVQQNVGYFLPVCCCQCTVLCCGLLGRKHRSWQN